MCFIGASFRVPEMVMLAAAFADLSARYSVTSWPWLARIAHNATRGHAPDIGYICLIHCFTAVVTEAAKFQQILGASGFSFFSLSTLRRVPMSLYRLRYRSVRLHTTMKFNCRRIGTRVPAKTGNYPFNTIKERTSNYGIFTGKSARSLS